jgi:hypothetical protein
VKGPGIPVKTLQTIVKTPQTPLKRTQTPSDDSKSTVKQLSRGQVPSGAENEPFEGVQRVFKGFESGSNPLEGYTEAQLNGLTPEQLAGLGVGKIGKEELLRT